MADARLLGVAAGEEDMPRIAYLNEAVPVTPDSSPSRLRRSRERCPVLPRCASSRALPISKRAAQLAVRIVEDLAAVTDKLPPCIIRSSCRWYQQEGAQARYRCPQIITHNEQASASALN